MKNKSNSNKQKRKEIKAKRVKKAQKLAGNIDVFSKRKIPEGAILANHQVLAANNKSPFPHYPEFYIDQPFVCRDCGSHEVWTAKQQKWWYEVAGGNLEQIAIRCRPCRKKEQLRKAEARRVHLEGLAKKKNYKI